MLAWAEDPGEKYLARRLFSVSLICVEHSCCPQAVRLAAYQGWILIEEGLSSSWMGLFEL